mmetsp:Transcript_16726/g.25276  ORF Transcript_16726/g.25276 Transcript_16726/m.25276 type:complete len:95 (+) Transcript_16726:39-323(+)
MTCVLFRAMATSMLWMMFTVLMLSINIANGLDNGAMDHLLDVTSRYEERQYATPLFWHIHKAGGTALHDFLSSCLNMTVASEVGILDGHDKDEV